MYETPSCFNVTVTVSRDGGQLPDPVTFGAAADRAAWCRSASIVSAHMADKIISVVTVHAPDRFAAEAIARAVVLDALHASRDGLRASGGTGVPSAPLVSSPGASAGWPARVWA